MDTTQRKPKLIKKNVATALRWLLSIGVALVISTLLVLQAPYVQNYLCQRFLQQVEHDTPLKITCQHFKLRGLSTISIDGLNIQDKQDKNICKAAKVTLKVDPWRQLNWLPGSATQQESTIRVLADNLFLDAYYGMDSTEPQKFFIEQLSTSLSFVANKLVCKDVKLRTRHSTLQGSCVLTYDGAPSSLSYDNVHALAHISSSTLSSEDLGLFMPYFKLYKACYYFAGTIEGKLDDLQLKDFQFDLADLDNDH